MTCKLCGAPIHYADIDRRYPLDEHGGHVCLSRRVRVRMCGRTVPGAMRLPRVREQRKGRDSK